MFCARGFISHGTRSMFCARILYPTSNTMFCTRVLYPTPNTMLCARVFIPHRTRSTFCARIFIPHWTHSHDSEFHSPCIYDSLVIVRHTNSMQLSHTAATTVGGTMFLYFTGYKRFPLRSTVWSSKTHTYTKYTYSRSFPVLKHPEYT
jgi:hypothetical protein